MTENDLIELYSNIDDFYHRYIKTNEGKTALTNYYGKRGPKRKLTVPEVMTLNIVKIMTKVMELKAFHALAKEFYKDYFPNLPNYENFMKATNKSAPFIAAYCKACVEDNRNKNKETVFYIDSTPVPVCDIRFANSHKVMKGIASRGKSTKGWFYGFKLQGVCKKDGTLVSLMLRNGSEHDSQAFIDVTEGLEGTFVADAGYLLKKKDKITMYSSGRVPFAAPRRNMKQLVSYSQLKLLRNRNCIENVWHVMKRHYGLVHTIARSVDGMFSHFFYSIAGYLIHDYKKKHKSEPLLQQVIAA